MTIRGPLAGLKVQMKERRKQNGSDHNGKWEGRNGVAAAAATRFCAAAISRFRTARAMG